MGNGKQFVFGLIMVAAAIAAVPASAATVTWTGGGNDWDYANAANWSALPRGTSWEDTVVFGASATAGKVLVNDLDNPTWGPDNPSHYGITFQTAGWTLSDDGGYHYTDLTDIDSAGAGVNIIENSFNTSSSNDVTWTIGADNTLILEKEMYQKGRNITLNGGGTLEIHTTNGIRGYGTNPGDYGIYVTGATLRITAGSVYAFGTGGSIFISDDAAVLQLKTSEVGAQDLISSNRIIDDYGQGLNITPITIGGEDYVQITAIPEPASIALLAIGGLAMLKSRR